MSEKKLGRGIASLLAMDDVADDKTLSTPIKTNFDYSNPFSIASCVVFPSEIILSGILFLLLGIKNLF